MNYQATMFAANNSESQKVRLTVSQSGLRVSGDNLDKTVVLHDIESSPPLAGLPQELKLPCGTLLVLEDGQQIQELISRSNSFVNWLEKNKLACFIALILVPLLLYLLIDKVIPAGAKKVTPLIPQVVRVSIDEQVLLYLDKTFVDESQLEQDKVIYWRNEWRELLLSLSLDTDKYKLHFRHMGVANAFALPGGSVVVTDTLIDKLSDQPNAIKAVLLHEIGHVEHQHGLQMVAESVAISLLMTYVMGDMEGVAELFTGSFLTIIQNQFSQSLETEADTYAIKRLRQLGIPPSALSDALSAIAPSSEEFELFEKYFSSHPSLKRRVENVNGQHLD